MTWEPTYDDYPDVAVRDEHGILRGYRLEAAFWLVPEALRLLKESGFSPKEADAYLDALRVEFWPEDEAWRWGDR